MKKLVMVTLLLVAGVAFASSLSVPWFIDTFDFGTVTAYTNIGYPPWNNTAAPSIQGLVYLHNTTGADITCAIEYYSKLGVFLGPDAPDNTFIITPNSTIMFRPNASDPTSQTKVAGQEDAAGMSVPTWTKTATNVGEMWSQSNGSIVVRWPGYKTDVQGNYIELWGIDASTAPGARLNAFAALLPAGVGAERPIP